MQLTHKAILEIFGKKFPLMQVVQWWKKGEKSIRLRFSNGEDLVFTHASETDWRLETLLSWARNDGE